MAGVTDYPEKSSASGWTLAATVATVPPLRVEVRILQEAPQGAPEGGLPVDECKQIPSPPLQLDDSLFESLIEQYPLAQEGDPEGLAASPELLVLLVSGIRSFLSKWEKSPRGVVREFALSNLANRRNRIAI